MNREFCSFCLRLWELYRAAKKFEIDPTFELSSMEEAIQAHMEREHKVSSFAFETVIPA
jgi:hypothetical protein